MIKRVKNGGSVIICKGERYNLGKYSSEVDAAYIHDIWDIHLYRDFATCNSLENGTPMISNELKDWILANGIPKGYERIQRRERELPPCIRLSEYGYFYQKERKENGKRKFYTGKVGTLEHAKEGLAKLEEKFRLEKQEKHLKQKILRNKKGIPYIPVKFRGRTYHFLVNKSIWRELMKIKWSGLAGGNYAHGKDEDGIDWRMHVYIFVKFMGGTIEEGESVDHIISRNKRDNRFSNLRALDASGQSHNTERPNKSIKLPTGVNVSMGLFAVICAKVYGGRFKTVEEAAHKYNELAKKIFGKNAKLNVITTSGTTVKKLFPKDIFTPKYISKLNTVVELQELIRSRKDWKKKYGLTYAQIRRNTLLDFKETMIKIAIKELGFDDRNDIEEEEEIEEETSEEDYGLNNLSEDAINSDENDNTEDIKDNTEEIKEEDNTEESEENEEDEDEDSE